MPTDFVEKLFPKDISYGSVFKQGYSNRIGESLSGFESVNINWENSRLVVDVKYGVRRQSQLTDLLNFFHEMMGSAYAFRFFDHTDFRSKDATDPTPETYQDQIILDSAVGGETVIQTVKNYGTVRNTVREIFKLDSAFTYLLGINGTEKFSPGDFTVDYDTGIVTLSSGLTALDQVTAGYQYHVPMRFQEDEIPVTLEYYQGGGSGVILIEKRIDNGL